MKSLIYKSFVLVLLLGAISACDDFGDMNIDPNEPTEVPAEGLVTNALFGSAYTYWDRTANFEMGMLFTQHFAQAEYTEEQRYDFNPSDFDALWAIMYAGGYSSNNIGQGVLADLREAKTLIAADEGLAGAVKANQIAILDLIHRDKVIDAKIEKISDTELQGFRFSDAWATDQRVYFYLKTSHSFNDMLQSPPLQGMPGGRKIALRFVNPNNEPVYVKIGISAIDEEIRAESNVNFAFEYEIMNDTLIVNYNSDKESNNYYVSSARF